MRPLVSLILAIAMSSATTAAPDISKVKGNYDLWEDFEGGKVCKVVLTSDQTIGGYVFKGDNRCIKVFKFDGDPHAWFIDQKGWLTIVDAARKVLVRLQPLEDGTFHADRSADRLEGVVLSRP